MLEITLLIQDPRAEAMADFLMEAGALSACLEDADLDTPDEAPLYGEPGMEPRHCSWPRTFLKVLIDESEVDADILLASLQSTYALESVHEVARQTLPEVDWVRVTQAQFPPTQVSERLWIVPSWHEAPDDNAINLRLDPGVAFGTGSHPTTHLCLQWLDEHLKPGDSVMDYGCGTGILAIAASLMGAGSIEGVDIDPQAVESATFNASQNGVTGHFHLPGACDRTHYDKVIANILCGPLEELAPLLTGFLAPGSTLVLSGILADQAPSLMAHYEAVCPGLRMRLWRQQEDWVCLVGVH